MLGWSLRSQMIGVGECSLKGIFSNGDIFGIVCGRRRLNVEVLESVAQLCRDRIFLER